MSIDYASAAIELLGWVAIGECLGLALLQLATSRWTILRLNLETPMFGRRRVMRPVSDQHAKRAA